MKKKDNTNMFLFIAIVILIIVIELFGDYCNKHKEELREREWKRFEAWHNDIMAGNTGIKWDAKD